MALIQNFIIEKALLIINKIIKTDPQYTYLLSKIQNKSIKIMLTDINYEFTITAQDSKIILTNDKNINAVLASEVSTFVAMMVDKDYRGFFYRKQIKFSGETGTLLLYFNFIKAFKPDVIYAIANILGDIPAGILEKSANKCKKNVSSNIKSTKNDTYQYLHYEKKYLVSKIELEYFYSELQSLKTDIDRLDAKIAKLNKRHKKTC